MKLINFTIGVEDREIEGSNSRLVLVLLPFSTRDGRYDRRCTIKSHVLSRNAPGNLVGDCKIGRTDERATKFSIVVASAPPRAELDGEPSSSVSFVIGHEQFYFLHGTPCIPCINTIPPSVKINYLTCIF